MSSENVLLKNEPKTMKETAGKPETGAEVQAVVVHEPVTPLEILALRSTIAGCGVLGVYLFIRNSRLFTRLKHINQIPQSYIHKETKLKGVIRALDSNGVFKVEHQPEIGLPRFLQPKHDPSKLLRLRLAGLDVSKAGVDYLIKDLRLKDRNVIFNVVKTAINDSDTADAEIAFRKSFWGSVNLNVDLIRRGLARVYTLEQPHHYEALQNNSVYSRLITRLLTSEKVAERRGVGVWERESWVESVQSLPYAAGQMVRHSTVIKFFVLLGRIFYDLCLIVINILRHGYHFSVATASCASSAYRSFGQRVDQFSKFYDGQKLRLQRIRSTVISKPSSIHQQQSLVSQENKAASTAASGAKKD